MSTGYFVKDDVLVDNWTLPQASKQDDCSVVTQIVVPQVFRHEILLLAHDNPLAGHLWVNKTYDRLLHCFFWPGLKRDVRQHCKTCHVCQVVGQPNQVIPPYPLYPIPVVGEPFEWALVDCVGPFPRTKSESSSRIFAQVLKQLNIAHCHSSTYHPESQGAIMRFHLTLKSMLRT